MSRDVERPATKKVAFVWPVDLIEAMRELARQDRRSLNGEIIFALQEYVTRRAQEAKEQTAKTAC